MSETVLKIAVVGHTNTGKTSLLRTLTRDVEFGEVSDHPAVTRHVEGTRLYVEGRPMVELYDTPGLEDSIGLLEHLDELAGGRRLDGVDLIGRFLDGDAAGTTFAQEAKAIRQVLASDVALYVVDARDRVLGKHRDELEILARCARPVVPVLNFTASSDSRADEWREHLARVNLHAVAAFDTVVYDAEEERRLFEKIATLLDRHRPTLEALVAERKRQREQLERAATELIADLLIDVAACVRTVPRDDRAAQRRAGVAMEQDVRAREQACVDAMLDMFRFRPGDARLADLPLDEGRWGVDLFDPESLKQFGVGATSGAAAGALAGLAVDAMSGGITLGAAAATGAAIGAVLGAGGSHARRLVHRVRGLTELRVSEPTLRLLAARQSALVRALLRRGHAAVDELALGDDPAAGGPSHELSDVLPRVLPKPLRVAMSRPAWSRLDAVRGHHHTDDGRRREAVETLADALGRGGR